MRSCVQWLLIGLIVLSAVGRSAPPSWAYDGDGLRGYLGLRVGGFPIFKDTKSDSEIHLEKNSETLGGAVLGFNWDKHWGFEVAGERSKQGLVLASTGGRTAFYPWWTLLGQIRWRYPILNDRLTPYLIAGGGFRFTEVEQKDSDSPVFFGNDQVPVGTGGGGLEYFIMNNVTLGVELKYIFGADSEIGTLTGRHKLDMDVLVYTFGLRVFYPE
jgi:opacity protein-like surface antigen